MILQRVVGVCFQGRARAIARLREGDEVLLVQEDRNPHDPCAVAVRNLDGHSLGYIPRDATAGARRYIRAARQFQVEGDGSSCKCTVYEAGAPPTTELPFLVLKLEHVET